MTIVMANLYLMFICKVLVPELFLMMLFNTHNMPVKRALLLTSPFYR